MDLALVHPSAYVHPDAKVGANVSIGPWCIVDAGVEIGDGAVLESRVHIYPGTTIGKGTKIFDGAIIGAAPQDLKYKGEATGVQIGSDCLIREYCTVNRGTGAEGMTRIQDKVLLMAYVHVAHDCKIGQGAVLANRCQLGGHVQLGSGCVLGGGVFVQQFTRIGAFAFIGGTQKVERHVPPFSRALGNPLRWAGLNLHGLRRALLDKAREKELKIQISELFTSEMTLEAFLQVHAGDLDPILSDFFMNWNGGLLPRPRP
jgi:UDP-N-acetylglucosamine acyltransferase